MILRTTTLDLQVAGTCLVDQSYSSIKIIAPAVIIDAGANIGASSVYFARRWPGAKIIAIELERENYDILVRNTARFENIIPVNAALWGSKGTKTIQDRLTGSWGYTVSETSNKTISTGQQVECVTVVELIERYNLPHIDLLKMDIEGSEKNVMENSGGWIDKVSVITAELHDGICEGCSASFQQATRGFARLEKNDKKVVTVYRN